MEVLKIAEVIAKMKNTNRENLQLTDIIQKLQKLDLFQLLKISRKSILDIVKSEKSLSNTMIKTIKKYLDLTAKNIKVMNNFHNSM